MAINETHAAAHDRPYLVDDRFRAIDSLVEQTGVRIDVNSPVLLPT